MIEIFSLLYILTLLLLVSFYKSTTTFGWGKSILLGLTTSIPVTLEFIYTGINFVVVKLIRGLTEVGFILGGEDFKSVQASMVKKAIGEIELLNRGDESTEEPIDKDKLQ